MVIGATLQALAGCAGGRGSAPPGSGHEGLQPGSPWPKFHADTRNAGLGSGSGAIGTTKWAFVTGGEIGSSAAIGADGTVYVGSDDGSLYAIR